MGLHFHGWICSIKDSVFDTGVSTFQDLCSTVHTVLLSLLLLLLYSKPLIPVVTTPSKQGNCWCSSKWSNLDQFDYTYNSELDAPSLHVLLP